MTVTTMTRRRTRRIRSITITLRRSGWTTSANNDVSYMLCDQLRDGA
jgi:hypothetical protein